MNGTKQLFCGVLLATALVSCGSVPRVGPVPVPVAVQPSDRAEALFHTLSTLDIDYRRGGHTPASGFDCSGLALHVYRAAYGIQLPRLAEDQGRAGLPVGIKALEPGDLVFYNTQRRPYSHVGIYIGDERFVHAPKPGAAVRVESMRAAYWTRRYDGARRILDR
jgi:cell wall-associated NlpC family hydrolase